MARTKNGTVEYLLIAAAVFAGAWFIMGSRNAPNGAEAAQLPAPQAASGPLNLRGAKVLLIGSSSAVGYGSRLKTLLEGFGIAEFKNIGKSGTFLSQWSDNDKEMGKKLEETLASYRPTVVFIFVGSNDECGRGSGTKAPAIERLHRKLQGTRSIFIGLPPHTKWSMIRSFRDLLASTWGEDYFNTEAVNPAKAADGYHLSSAGYQALSNALGPWLASKQGL
jgi:lysophospholipase L1-like esterase